MTKPNAQYQRAYIAAKKARGLKRLVLWVEPEAVDDLRLAAKQPHALARLKRAVQDELKPEIERQVRHHLTRTTRRAMLAQRRAQVRRQAGERNRPPERPLEPDRKAHVRRD